MAQHYLQTLIGPGAEALQTKAGSRESYARMISGGNGLPDAVGDREAEFIAARDSFYMASVSEDGWPYVQHRGGPAGFLKVFDEHRIAFADYRGNRQYLTTANLLHDDRVALFLMDYPNQRRLKLIGHAHIVEPGDDPALFDRLMAGGYKAVPERSFVIDIVGHDWNCPQHITPRFTEAEIEAAVAPLKSELETIRAEVARLKEQH